MAKNKKGSLMDRFLNVIEYGCNKLPSPFTMFMWLFLFIAFLSLIFSMLGVSVTSPSDGSEVVVQNFFSQEGLSWFLKSVTTNFSGFASLGLVLSMTLGISLCEQVGLVDSLLKKSMANVSAGIVPYVVALIGTCGNLASDTCSVLVPPLAAIAFLGVGRSPVAGLMCGWIAANAGFSANLMIAGTDSLLAGITNTSIQVLLGSDTTFTVDSACNWFFMVASTFLVTIVVGWCTNHLLEPRVGKYHGEAALSKEELTPIQLKGLRNSGIVLLVYVAVIVIGIVAGPLANPETGGIVGSLFLSGLIPIILLMFVLCGIAYGVTTGVIKNERDVTSRFTKAMAGMGSFVAFCFAAGQFTALFNWTKIGTVIAIAGANFLQGVGFTGAPMFVGIIILTILINLFMSSGSAKWTILGPIFVPMLMLLGYHPAFTQLIYRIGDSPTNALAPLSPYLYMCLAVMNEKYDKDMKLGSFLAPCIPTVAAVQVIWIAFLLLWYFVGLPLGPGAPIYLPAGII